MNDYCILLKIDIYLSMRLNSGNYINVFLSTLLQIVYTSDMLDSKSQLIKENKSEL